MTLTVELPNDLASHEDPAREALEAVALEAYRTGALTRPEAATLLKMGRIAFDDLLIKKGLTADFYDVDDLLQDIETSDRLRAAGLLPG